MCSRLMSRIHSPTRCLINQHRLISWQAIFMLPPPILHWGHTEKITCKPQANLLQAYLRHQILMRIAAKCAKALAGRTAHAVSACKPSQIAPENIDRLARISASKYLRSRTICLLWRAVRWWWKTQQRTRLKREQRGLVILLLLPQVPSRVTMTKSPNPRAHLTALLSHSPTLNGQ